MVRGTLFVLRFIHLSVFVLKIGAINGELFWNTDAVGKILLFICFEFICIIG